MMAGMARVTSSDKEDAVRLRISRADSPEGLRLGASTLGRALVELTPDSESVRAWKLEAAGLRRRGQSYEDGYLSALADLLASAEESIRVASEKAAHLERARTPLLRSILLALRERPLGPTPLARTLRRDVAQVSRAFDELEQAGLVAPAQSRDERARPRELTPLGHWICSELSHETNEHSKLASEVAARAMRFAGIIAHSGSVGVGELPNLVKGNLPRALVEPVVTGLLRSAEDEGLIDAHDDGRVEWLGGIPIHVNYPAFTTPTETTRVLTHVVEGVTRIGNTPPTRIVLCTTATRLRNWVQAERDARSHLRELSTTVDIEVLSGFLRLMEDDFSHSGTLVVLDDLSMTKRQDVSSRIPAESAFALRHRDRRFQLVRASAPDAPIVDLPLETRAA
jgi:DNA-binding MarR family transcriptional regulator